MSDVSQAADLRGGGDEGKIFDKTNVDTRH
jgi:hypothetical protein